MMSINLGTTSNEQYIHGATCDMENYASIENNIPVVVCEEHTFAASLSNTDSLLVEELDHPESNQLNTLDDSVLVMINNDHQYGNIKPPVNQDDCVINAVINKAEKVYEEISILSDDEMSDHSIPDIRCRQRIPSDDCLIVCEDKLPIDDSAVCITVDDNSPLSEEDFSTNGANTECIIIDDEDQDCQEVHMTASLSPSMAQIFKAFLCAKQDYVNGLRRLSLSGFDLDCKNSKRWTLLMAASFIGSLSVVKYLLSKKVDLDKKDKDNNTAESLALEQGHMKIFKLLQSYKRTASKYLHVEDFYCKICKEHILQSTKMKHELSIIHQSKIAPTKLHSSQMLLKCGWNGETGLGNNEQGNKFLIATEPKNNCLGLGHVNVSFGKAKMKCKRCKKGPTKRNCKGCTQHTKSMRPKAGSGQVYCKYCCEVVKAPMLKHNKLVHPTLHGKAHKTETTPSAAPPLLPHNTFHLSSQNIGYQMLMKCGWDGKNGLGKDSQGKKFPIETETKNDRLGLGHEKPPSHEEIRHKNIKKNKLKLPKCLKMKKLKVLKDENIRLNRLYRLLK